MVKVEEALSLIPHIEFGFIVKEKSECKASGKKKKVNSAYNGAMRKKYGRKMPI